jgi:DNA-binding NarL/FixJ family response regulator
MTMLFDGETGARIDDAAAGAVPHSSKKGGPPVGAKLNGAETRVIEEIVAGNDTSKGIARKFGVSDRTVEGQLRSIRCKLGVATTLQAALVYDRRKRRGFDREAWE